MLYTRCPECETTFRITEGALQQAQGQVRCGRCAHIFDARESLTDRLPDPDEPAADLGEVPAPAQANDRGAAPDGPDAADEDHDAEAPAAAPEPPGIDAETAAELALAAEIEMAETDAADDETDTAQAGTGTPVMSADEIDAVLGSPAATPHWLDDDELQAQPPRSRLLLAVALGAVLLLGGQLIHHFRSQLAGTAGIGPVVQSVYAALGGRAVPNWDVTRYELVDWIAVETAGERAQRNLLIRSQLRNGADRAQPYPLMHLKLLNRWEDAVGARLFEPREYAPGDGRRDMMQAGETIAAELVIVDPGADAYGFELAVCLETATGVVCDTDATFR